MSAQDGLYTTSLQNRRATKILRWLLSNGLLGLFGAVRHDLMCQFHKPVDEKRIVVILPTDCYDTGSSQNRRTACTSCGPYPTQNRQASAVAIASVQGGSG